MNIGNKDRTVDLVNINDYTINLIEAAIEYLARKVDEERVLEHGRYVRKQYETTWVPFTRELCSCCTSHNGHMMSGRTLQDHFKSPTHIATLFKVDRSELLKIVFVYEHVLLINRLDRETAIAHMASR